MGSMNGGVGWLLCWLLLCYGFSNVVVGGNVTYNFRAWMYALHVKLGELFECMMCFGFWVGVILALLGLKVVLHPNVLLEVLCNGFLSSGGVWVINCVMVWLGDGEAGER